MAGDVLPVAMFHITSSHTSKSHYNLLSPHTLQQFWAFMPIDFFSFWLADFLWHEMSNDMKCKMTLNVKWWRCPSLWNASLFPTSFFVALVCMYGASSGACLGIIWGTPGLPSGASGAYCQQCTTISGANASVMPFLSLAEVSCLKLQIWVD